MSMSQLFRAKGGYVRHNVEGFAVRLEIRVGESIFVGRTGADLKGFRYLEGLMREKLVGLPYGLEPTSKSVMGIDTSFFRKLCPEGGFEKRIRAMQALLDQQHEQYDKKGFLVAKEVKRGTVQGYFEGEEMDVLVCPNEVSKKRMMRALQDEDGSWEGLEFRFARDEVEDFGTVCEFIIEDWVAAKFEDSAYQAGEFAGASSDWVDEVETDLVDNGFPAVPEDMVNIFLKGWREPISSKPEHERELVYWGGGKRPSSERLRKDLVRKTFPSDQRMPIKNFMAQVKKNLVEIWGFEDHKPDMGEVDLDRLVIGQMLRAKGHLEIRYSDKTIEYVPRPKAYLASQARGKME